MPESGRLRVLLVTRNLPPLTGGMERLNWHMAEMLSRQADIRIVGPGGAAALAPPGVSVREVPLRPLWRFLLGSQWGALREARRWRPDVVLAGSGLTALSAWFAARTVGARAATYAHGLDLTVSHPVYRHVWLPVLRRMDCIITNSRATAVQVERMGVAPDRIGVVHPGVEMPASVPAKAMLEGFRARHDLDGRPLLLSVGRLSTRKGLLEFVSLALPKIVSRRPEVVLLVVGDVPKNALRAQAQSPLRIQDAADRVGVSENVRFLGVVPDAELELAYSAADVHVFPVRDIPGDPEGFGMVAVEAAAHGLPTVAFACGGVVDAVEEDISGHLIESGDYEAFAGAVLKVLDAGGGLRARCVEFAGKFVWPVFGEKLFQRLSRAMPSHARQNGGRNGA